MIKALKKYKDEVLKAYLVICLIVEIVLTMVRNSKEEKHNEDNYYEDRYGKDEES